MIDYEERGEWHEDVPLSFRDVELVDGPLDGGIVSIPPSTFHIQFPLDPPSSEAGSPPPRERIEEEDPSEFLVYEDSGEVRSLSPGTIIALFHYHP